MINFAFCFMIGKAHEWETFLRCRVALDYRIILGLLFWEPPHVIGHIITWREFPNVLEGHYTKPNNSSPERRHFPFLGRTISSFKMPMHKAKHFDHILCWKMLIRGCFFLVFEDEVVTRSCPPPPRFSNFTHVWPLPVLKQEVNIIGTLCIGI